MLKVNVAPYGSWESPITSDLIASGSVRLRQIRLDGEDVYWVETRPAENGRYALVKWTPGHEPVDVVSADYSVRTRVHEYGGGAFTVSDGVIYFANFADQRLYRQEGDATPRPLTPTGDGQLRYADLTVDLRHGRLIAVREDHGGGGEAANTLVGVRLDGNDAGEVMVSGPDFVSSPRLSPDGSQLAWLAWNHPQMPWDGAELWLADVAADGRLTNSRAIAGGPDESIFQPEWSPTGVLHFVSDRSNWWNLYRWENNQAHALHPMAAEFGLPQWAFGMATYDFAAADSIIGTYTQNGRWFLARLNTTTGALTNIDLPYDVIADHSTVRVGGGHALFKAGAADRPDAIVRLDLDDDTWNVLRQSTNLAVEPGYLSRPEAITFPTADDQTAHGFFYPPHNQEYTGPDGSQPPLIVISHGGPTSATNTRFDLEIQYWTSRGFGVLDVNYGGSTGYGRRYRRRLNGNWGVVDVQDCINGARYLAEQDRVDGNRLVIRGGSAGGYTTLCALTFHDTFSAGASHFGISDVEALARETHKFESRYLNSLIGPYPDAKSTYQQRSPIHFVDQINCPLILFQGLEDKVVPPAQSEKMYTAVKAKGLPTAYVAFAGENHGFRKAENIKRALDAELFFYSRVFNFELPMPVAPVDIANLEIGD